MNQFQSVRQANWRYGPVGGAGLGVALTFAYALVFVLYATVRSAVLVTSAGWQVNLPGTMLAYASSLTVAALAIAAIMALPAAVIGMLTAIGLKKLAAVLNPEQQARRATLIGLIACLLVVGIFHLVAQRGLGFAVSDVIDNAETYLLWLGIPSLIYIAAGSAAMYALNGFSATWVTPQAARPEPQLQLTESNA